MIVKLLLKRLNMEINITSRLTKLEKKYVTEAVHFYMAKLIKKPLMKDLVINISCKRNLKDGDEGWCEVEGCNSKNRPIEFSIVIKKDESFRKMLMTLAHECVHVKQYTLRELSSSHDIFRGKKYKDNIEYWESPWEIEAFGRERGLYTLFCEHYGYKFKKITIERDE